jgi:outer membrane cobalamin receptor
VFAPAPADELAEPPPGEPAAPVIYETATVRAQPLARATAAVTVLDRAQIEALGVVSVAELMRFVPGLDVTSTGPRAGPATAQIRGGDPNFTAVLLDGVPLNDITDEVGGAVDLNALSAVEVERIEVVRGPLSMFFGSTGLSGAINIITRRGAGEGTTPAFEVAVGTAGFARAALSLSQAAADREHLVGAWAEREEERVAEDEFRELAAWGNARLGLGGGELRLSGRAAAWETEDYPEASGGPVLGSGQTRHSEHDQLSLGADWRLGEGRRDHRLVCAAARHRRERTSPEILDPSGDLAIPASAERTTFTRARLGWSSPWFAAGRGRLVAGADLDLEDGRSDSVLYLPAELGGPTDGSYRTDRLTAGVLVDFVREWGALLFEAGGRLDLPEGFEGELSPRVGLVWRPDGSATRVRASLGRAFKLPSFFALASPPALGGNPALAPETAVGADAGVEHAFAGRGPSLALTAFFQRFSSLIDFDFDERRLVNRDEVDSRGAELAVSWAATSETALRLNLTRQEIDIRDSPDELRQRPEWIGAASFAWHALPALDWELDGQWVSERADEQIPVADRAAVAGYHLFGSAVTYAWDDRWQLRARIDNLTDEEYETFIGFPGPGRSLRVGLRRR